ncbi:hypothetical protein Bbelb_240070 [Branchiostoma belcheri]|nr:hypothetical protein Bbelb_240070 [Branchiostoma belcheri]
MFRTAREPQQAVFTLSSQNLDPCLTPGPRTARFFAIVPKGVQAGILDSLGDGNGWLDYQSCESDWGRWVKVVTAAEEHDVGKHGAVQEGQAAGQALGSGERASRRATKHREPHMVIVHVPDKCKDSITRTALRWTPQGSRPRGRPKETWRRTIDKEVRSHGFTLDEAPKMAADRARWKSYLLP